MCKSGATLQARDNSVCLEVRRDSSASNLDRAEIAFVLASFHRLKLLTDEGEEETEVPGENPPGTSCRKCRNLKIKAATETRTRTVALVADACWGSRRADHYTTSRLLHCKNVAGGG